MIDARSSRFIYQSCHFIFFIDGDTLDFDAHISVKDMAVEDLQVNIGKHLHSKRIRYEQINHQDKSFFLWDWAQRAISKDS